jgi:hypothetical protein
MTGAHYLLPHERRAAGWLERRSASLAYEQLMRNSGPEGLRLQAAAWANYFPGALLLFAGVIARLIQPHGVPVAAICLWTVGLMIMAIAMVRTIELAVEGRRFRAARNSTGS